nr:rho GTPase-activating protein 44-like [Dromaius novaehollandiae]
MKEKGTEIRATVVSEHLPFPPSLPLIPPFPPSLKESAHSGEGCVCVTPSRRPADQGERIEPGVWEPHAGRGRPAMPLPAAYTPSLTPATEKGGRTPQPEPAAFIVSLSPHLPDKGAPAGAPCPPHFSNPKNQVLTLLPRPVRVYVPGGAVRRDPEEPQLPRASSETRPRPVPRKRPHRFPRQRSRVSCRHASCVACCASVAQVLCGWVPGRICSNHSFTVFFKIPSAQILHIAKVAFAWIYHLIFSGSKADPLPNAFEKQPNGITET